MLKNVHSWWPLILLLLVPSAHANTIGNWEEIYEDEGIKVSRKGSPDSDLFAFRGAGVIDAPISKVLSVIRDINRAKEWVDSASELRIVRQLSPLDRIEYYHIDIKFPLISDRDFVYRTVVNVDKEAKEIVVHSSSIEDAEVPERSGLVRGKIFDTRLILKPVENGTKTFAVGEAHTDPKGSLPSWLVNMIQKNWPYKTFINVRNQLAKGNIEDDPLALSLSEPAQPQPPQPVASPAAAAATVSQAKPKQ